jgi:hypothetical protein
VVTSRLEERCTVAGGLEWKTKRGGSQPTGAMACDEIVYRVVARRGIDRKEKGMDCSLISLRV